MCYSALIERDLSRLPGSLRVKVREQIYDYQAFPDQVLRIFPGSAAPVFCRAGDDFIIEPMRYGAHAPAYVSNPNIYTTFNARRDNLDSNFWEDAFLVGHGFVALRGFFEWVQVRDLLAAGVVNIEQVTEEFQRQSAERRKKIEDEGKKYKPTKTELTDPRFRKIVICFKPQDEEDLLVPVIFNHRKNADGTLSKAFAIITDDPPPEIQAAGHDRCPLTLTEHSITAWLAYKGKDSTAAKEILSQGKRLSFTHSLDRAA